MAKLIGTAGHVDHGKTSLIRALTGIDADRLPEERARGLTIDLGFAYVDFPEIGRVSIIDVPGHERFLSNMLVGVQGVDVAILCVSAIESVKPQTIEHLQILELLPVQSLVVALTFCDIAEAETFETARLEVEQLLASTRFSGSPVVPVSAETLEGIAQLKQHLEQVLRQETEPRIGPWLLPIDRVFSVHGHGTVVTGPLMQGEVRVGDEVEIQPGGFRSRVRQIQGHDLTLESASFGQRTALNLAGLKPEEIQRGHLAGEPGTVFESKLIDAEVRWIEKPNWGLRVRLSIGADEVIGRVYTSDLDETKAQIRLETPTGAAKGQSIIIRRYSPPNLLGGGIVLIPSGKVGKKFQSQENDRSLPLTEQILQIVEGAPRGIDNAEICRILGFTNQLLGDTIEKLISAGEIRGFAGYWFVPATWDSTQSAIIEALEDLHAGESQRVCFSKDQVARAIGLNCSQKALDRIFSHLVESGTVRSTAQGVSLTSHSVHLNPAQRQLLDRVKSQLELGGWMPLSPQEIAKQLGLPAQAVLGVLSLGIENGEIVRLQDDVWFTKVRFNQMVEVAKNHFGSEKFAASEFRNLFETSRKYAIPVLEYLDARRVTFRQGDTRFFIQTS